ncbi:MAG: class I SAM-dependent methyltransferase [Dehalococcoidia bacterium]|nr:class I SAM-dependent methyltransferase [Dehalococcoidia bacterium]
MAEFRAALRLRDDMSLRASVIDDLSTYYHCSEAECIERSVHWGRYFDEEWAAAVSPEAFHRTTTSSSFSLLWYAYCQAEGYVWPGVVGIAESVLTAAPAAGEHLDFAAAVGVTSQLFARMGFRTTLADISTTMLDFARFRLERRGTAASFIDLNESALPVGAFDVITASDVLWLVPDFDATMRELYGALKPGGVLAANIAPGGASTAPWELQHDEMSLRRRLQAVGFEPVGRVTGVYRKVHAEGAMRSYRRVRDLMLLNQWRYAYRSARSKLRGLRR